MNTASFVAVVRWSMFAGAVYDAATGILLLARPEIVARLLSIPMPDQEIHVRFIGIFLLVLAMFYLLPVVHAGRYLGNVAVAAAARTMGAVFMFTAVAAYSEPRAYLLLASVDLAFGAVHYLSLVPFNGLKVWQLAGADISVRAPSRVER